MTEQTTSDLTAEDVEFDADRDIVTYDPATIDADDLYDIRHEAEHIDAVALAARVEIERQNAIAYEQYRATFAQHELLDIGMMLMSAKKDRYDRGETDRVEIIQDLATAFLDGFDFSDYDLEVGE